MQQMLQQMLDNQTEMKADQAKAKAEMMADRRPPKQEWKPTKKTR
jgi:hypothetical protein